MNISQFLAKLADDASVDSPSIESLMGAFQAAYQNVTAEEIVPANEPDMNRQMQLIDSRYRAENALLDAIASGNEENAFRAIMNYGVLMQSPSQEESPSSENMLRDFKNSVHTMNTLFRKAIEGNYVHPIYIHESSSDFASRIEHADTIQALTLLIAEMIQRYCYLVRKYSVAVYSEPIRKAMLYIDLNLANPISTKEIAADQFLSPNYLSTRFHEETGKTITDFILEKRIKMACKLLKVDNKSIQEVASAVGFEDASYFSRQFKKIKGVSPLDFRKNTL